MSDPLSVYLLDNKICLKYGYTNLDSIYRETAWEKLSTYNLNAGLQSLYMISLSISQRSFLKLCKEVYEILLHVYSRYFAVYGRDKF